MGNLARQLELEVIEKLHQRVVEIALESKIATGGKMRVDTTVVETDIHYPTDSSLLGDGVRSDACHEEGHRRGGQGRHADARPQPLHKVEGFGDCACQPEQDGARPAEMKNAYVRVAGHCQPGYWSSQKRLLSEIAARVKQGNLSVMHKAKKQLDEMIPRGQQVMSQTRERVLRGNTKAEGKLLSVFETHTEVIRKGKANKPNEFGKLVLIQEAENQIVTHYEVCEQRPADSTLLEGCLKQHVEVFRTRSEASSGRLRILFRR